MNTEKASHLKSDGEIKRRRVILEESTSIYHDVGQPDPRKTETNHSTKEITTTNTSR